MLQNDAKTLTEILAHGYSSESESTQRALSNEYRHYRVWMLVFKKSLCPCALDKSIALALEGLSTSA